MSSFAITVNLPKTYPTKLRFLEVSILDNSTTARIASDFQSTWDQLFNIDNNNNNNSYTGGGYVYKETIEYDESATKQTQSRPTDAEGNTVKPDTKKTTTFAQNTITTVLVISFVLMV